jgi:hypothetical protein
MSRVQDQKVTRSSPAVNPAAGAAQAAPRYSVQAKQQPAVETADDWEGVDTDVKADPKSNSMSATRVALAKVKRGLKPTRVTVPYSFTFTCSAGTGVVSASQAVYADANNPEWNSFAALYDEYRVHGGLVKFQLVYTSPLMATGLDPNSMFVLCYDPTDATVLGSVREGTEMGQHTLVAASTVMYAGATNAYALGYARADGKPHEFKFSTGAVKGVTISSTGAINYSPGQWKGVNATGQNSPDGQLKTYGQTAYATATISVVGIVYLDVEFRSRK